MTTLLDLNVWLHPRHLVYQRPDGCTTTPLLWLLLDNWTGAFDVRHHSSFSAQSLAAHFLSAPIRHATEQQADNCVEVPYASRTVS